MRVYASSGGHPLHTREKTSRLETMSRTQKTNNYKRVGRLLLIIYDYCITRRPFNTRLRCPPTVHARVVGDARTIVTRRKRAENDPFRSAFRDDRRDCFRVNIRKRSISSVQLLFLRALCNPIYHAPDRHGRLPRKSRREPVKY